MKITRRMLHPDLQPASVYWPQTVVKYLSRNELGMKVTETLMGFLIRSEAPASVRVEERMLRTTDGEAQLRVRIYRPSSAPPGLLPAMLYTHGGGYVAGSPEVFDGVIARFIETRPCVVVAPAYRKALEKPYPAAFDDCYQTLLWIRDNAEELGVDPRAFIIGGHSAGGGLTAAVTLKARDTHDVKIAFQMPFYPMIDDRQPDDSARSMDVPGWDTKANAFGWGRYLRDLRRRGAEVPAYAAPARNTDYTGFPPTITFVGEYEPFRWETIEYVERLRAAGVHVAFKLYEKCLHGPEMIAPTSELGKDAAAFTLESYADFYDTYIDVAADGAPTLDGAR